MASAGTKKMCESGSPISLTSTRLSSSRWRNTSIGVPRARCLISRSRVPGGPKRLTSTFRASVVFTTQLSPSAELYDLHLGGAIHGYQSGPFLPPDGGGKISASGARATDIRQEA